MYKVKSDAHSMFTNLVWRVREGGGVREGTAWRIDEDIFLMSTSIRMLGHTVTWRVESRVE